MSWEAIWTLTGVLVAVALAVAPWMWKMASRTGEVSTAIAGMAEDIREIKEDVKQQIRTIWVKHDHHTERLDKHAERLNEHEVRLIKVEGSKANG